MFHAKNGQLKLEETSVDYIQFGTGENCLILIPGVGDGLRTVRGSALPFSFLYRMFTKEYTVFAFSRKNNLPETYTTEQMADDLSQCMDQLQIPKADLVGDRAAPCPAISSKGGQACPGRFPFPAEPHHPAGCDPLD